MEIEFNKLNISSGDSFNPNCLYCSKHFNEENWCRECDLFRRIEKWSSGNPDIDKFIKDTMYKQKYSDRFLEWVPFDKFVNIKEIGEGGFAKVYSATWIDGNSDFYKNGDGSWRKEEPEPKKIALKRLYGSQDMSNKYLNEVSFILYCFYHFYCLIL
ncbi:unnamed protein product [Rhizophagus irregularis]|nr:unnamed protein product [Rhizophagus irregularis]